MGKRSGLSRSRSSDVAGRFDAALMRAEALLPGVARTLAAVSGPEGAGARPFATASEFAGSGVARDGGPDSTGARPSASTSNFSGSGDAGDGGPTSAGVRGALAKDFSRTRTRADYLAVRAEPACRATSLARFAGIERLRCCLREVAGVDVRATAAELSALAGVCVDEALDEALARADARFGAPLAAAGGRCPIVVLGMGKLGGGELNAGSDIDLCFFYGTDDGATAQTEDSLHAYFSKVAEWTVKALDEPGDDGAVWRTDLRLRPEGTRGPLVNSVAAAERYYENWGRTWERAALLRASPIAGDRPLGDELQQALTPFVWRRTVDPKLPGELAALLQQARMKASKQDLKLGTGGIREVEFFVQGLQLVWGGKNPDLRTPHTLEALARLRARGFVTDREASELEVAWHFLRRVEHRIQAQSGLPTHTLPSEPAGLEALAVSLGFPTANAFEGALAATRTSVAAIYQTLLFEAGRTEFEQNPWDFVVALLDDRGLVGPGLDAVPSPAAPSPAAPSPAARTDAVSPYSAPSPAARTDAVSPYSAPSPAARTDALAQALAGSSWPPGVAGWSEGRREEFARCLVALARKPDLPLGERSRERYPAFVAHLFRTLGDSADPEQAARLLVPFFSRVASPEGYAKAFEGRPDALARLVSVLGTSRYLGEGLIGHPALVDRALFAFSVPRPGDAAKVLAEELRATAARPGDEDPLEAFVGATRRTRSRVLVDVGCAELAGEISGDDVAARVTELAETLIGAALDYVTANLPDSSLTVVALGKLGGYELAHGSDLDLIFVYDDRSETTGEDPDDAAERYARAAQRVLRLLTLPHGDGPGYDLDTRLRPSGNQGLLVVSLRAFAQYHGHQGGKRRAAPWERQALLKARPLGAQTPFATTVAETLRAIALADEPPDAGAMRAMREKMVRELYRPDENRRDLKQMPGGLVELAFAVQYAQMKAQIAETHTGRAIDALVPKGLTAEDAAILQRGLLRFGRAERAFRLLSGDSASVIDFRAPIAAHVARLLGYRTSGSTVIDDFRHDLDATAAAVHEVFERVVASPGEVEGAARPA